MRLITVYLYFKGKTNLMKSLFDQDGYQDILTRLAKLTPDTQRQWGKMTAAQMAWHCQYPLQLAIKNEDKGVRGNPLVRWFFKKSLYSDKPMRKSLPTASFLVAKEEKDFTTEVTKLQQLITDCHNVRERTQWNPHPFFGDFTPQQWGQLEYKHLDHHLKQFGLL